MYNYNFRNEMIPNTYVPNFDDVDRSTTTDERNTNGKMVGGMKLFSEKEAYMNGNLFESLYKPYKNYKPARLNPTNDRQKLFLELSEACFVAHELNLYLDLHPEDNNALKLFNEYRRESNELLEQFESKYGPLLVSSDALNTSPFLWEEQTFPWEKGGLGNV